MNWKNELENMQSWFIPAVIIFILLFFSIVVGIARAEEEVYTNDQIADAIYFAEGAEKAVKPFGILSIPCDGYDECRQICVNTIRNQRIRHAKHSCGLTYFECLANRYCPVGANNDPTHLNQYWLSNVKFFLKKVLDKP